MENPIQLETMQATYSQNDANETIYISIQDNGAGPYFEIKTDCWSFNDVQDMIDLLQNFKEKTK